MAWSDDVTASKSDRVDPQPSLKSDKLNITAKEIRIQKRDLFTTYK